MIAYFDHPLDSNLFQYSQAANGSTYWTVAHDRGIAFRAGLEHYGHECRVTQDYTDPGIYIVEVNGGPALWTGQAHLQGMTTENVIDLIPAQVVTALGRRQLKLVLLAWSEGHSFVKQAPDRQVKTTCYFDQYDAFAVIHSTLAFRGIPSDQVIIVHGNQRCQEEYRQWCQQHNQQPTLTLIPGLKFFNIFNPTSRAVDHLLIETAVVNQHSQDYNSLNRIIKSHRNDHFYELIARSLLDKGLVSGNYRPCSQHQSMLTDNQQWNSTVSQYFPRSIDIQDFEQNPADNFNSWIYENSLLTVITETHFDNDITFLSEKIFKPIAAGHPFLILGNPYTLQSLRQLGFRTDFAGIDHSYDLIIDNQLRFQRVHDQLEHWAKLPRAKKINLIAQSLPAIKHNFEHYRRLDLHRDLFNAIK